MLMILNFTPKNNMPGCFLPYSETASVQKLLCKAERCALVLGHKRVWQNREKGHKAEWGWGEGGYLPARIRKTHKTQFLIMILKPKCVFDGIEPKMNEANNTSCLKQISKCASKKPNIGRMRPQISK